MFWGELQGKSVGQLDSWQLAIISYFLFAKHEGVRFPYEIVLSA
jgi:hypothetical protein